MPRVFRCECSCKCGDCHDSDCDCECHDVPGDDCYLLQYCLIKKLTTKKNLSRNQMFYRMSQTDDPEQTLEGAIRFVKTLMKYAPDMKGSTQTHSSIISPTITKKRVKKTVCTDDV